MWRWWIWLKVKVVVCLCGSSSSSRLFEVLDADGEERELEEVDLAGLYRQFRRTIVGRLPD